MNQMINHPTRWDLERLYPETKDPTFSTEIEIIEQLIGTYKENSDPAILSRIIQRIEKAEYYFYCLSAEHADEFTAALPHTKINTLKTEVRLLLQESNHEKSNFFENQNINFIENELKAWEDMYIQLRNRLEVHHNNEILSFGKANYLAMNGETHHERLAVFSSLTEALEKEKTVFASVLNQIGRLRNLKSNLLQEKEVLSQSLQANGISKNALLEMWNAIEGNLEKLSSVIAFHKRSKETFTWHDLMTLEENNQVQIPFSIAVENIYEALKDIDEELAQFAQHAIMNGWVDAEPRDNKPPSGFCAPFLSEGESRISLRYDETIDSVRILAHELGHAWHFYVMSNEQSTAFLDDYLPMCMAESASIFFEMVLVDYLVKIAESEELRKSLLSWKIRNSFNYVMAIRASFQFEQTFYEESQKRPLSADELERLSILSQKAAYGNSLTEYQPFVWMKYGQFYTASVPFYNYPYTFGYLLSLGLLEIAKQDGSEFHSKYKKFLCETGKRPVEELVKQYFHIDLADNEFWEKALLQINKDIDEYLQFVQEEV
ncbi:oligoendopeptidase F [Bacillus pseudomycoides]|uniref:M3 family metallopeptidase n=1 Tax=Bacillus pseudomycoides TaxID=64104 RepID=UPI0001A161D0|nr:M3 family metallopeptidase [Bacillus pseudomycoides]EEM05290.1 Peptidase M3A and M3B thimet/oligopeptidase F [Bacillus pseudomycoides]MBD5797214.1 oligoendopeptidase F [Bacillus pseudomycoides]MED1476300.1 M3 family metallopeptidase [Bacillus pseudomycoides]PDZ10736.1 oligoendopeptidase F [Bacillus pseudomycoides]PEO92491.1 oligoendopeptidase F [Bacillus pseudomycoides]